MIGSFGEIVFEVNDKRVHTFNQLTRDSAGRSTDHEVLGQKPVTQFNGPGLDTVSLTIKLHGAHGVKPREEMEQWLIKERDGDAEFLFIGGKGLGVSRWMITRVSQAWNIVMNRGELLSANVSIELKEYTAVIRNSRRRWLDDRLR